MSYRSRLSSVALARSPRRFGSAALAALTFSPVAAVAAASTWGGRPARGSWSGQTSDHSPVSFTVTSGGTRMTSFKLAAQADCVDAYSQPVEGVELLFKRAKATAIDINGNVSFHIQETVPGVSGTVPFGIQVEFTAHHDIPPPAMAASGVVAGGFTADNGDYCVLGSSGDLDFTARPHR